MSLTYTDLEILEKNVSLSLDAIKKTTKQPIIQEAKELLKQEIETLLNRARVRQDFKTVKNTYAVTAEDNAQPNKVKKKHRSSHQIYNQRSGQRSSTQVYSHPAHPY